MIDAENLLLPPIRFKSFLQLPRRLQIATKWFFDLVKKKKEKEKES